MKPMLTGNSNRSAHNNTIFGIRGKWNDTEVGRIAFEAGPDTTNKDDGKINLYTRVSGGSLTSRLLIDSNGNIGISEASPQALLHLNDGANSAIMFGNTTHGYKIRSNVTSSNDYGLLIEDEDGVDLYRAVSSTGTSNTNTHTFFTGGSERLRIDASGRLLMGSVANSHNGGDLIQLSATSSTASIQLNRYTANALSLIHI